jgi:RNA polymerase sigma-70 factor (ECF subfamily)
MTPEPHQFFLDTLQRYERPLIRYAQNIVGQLDDARDIVQDVFVKLSQSLHTLDTERLAPWLFTVCKNRATDHLRKHSRITLMETETLDLEESDVSRPGFDMEQRETAETLRGLLKTLPDKQREAIRMKFMAGLSYKEISEVMKTSVGNVGYLIHHGVNALREQWRVLDANPSKKAVLA